VLNGDDGVNQNSSPEHSSDELHEVGRDDDNEICNRVSKRLKTTTTTVVSKRKCTETIDELVDKEFDHCDDFDDNVSIQTSNTDLNNQLASWQQRNDETETFLNLIVTLKPKMELSLLHVMLLSQITKFLMTMICTKFVAVSIN